MFTGPNLQKDMLTLIISWSHLQVQWHFNVPLWASAGGLWESGISKMKYHLKRVLGKHKLTFEQLHI